MRLHDELLDRHVIGTFQTLMASINASPIIVRSTLLAFCTMLHQNAYAAAPRTDQAPRPRPRRHTLSRRDALRIHQTVPRVAQPARHRADVLHEQLLAQHE